MLLEVENLHVRYDRATILNGIDFTVGEGELVGLVGPNGAGKSTFLRAVTGLIAWEKQAKRGTRGGEIDLEGTVTFNGERIEKLPAHKIVKLGFVHCPERRRPFREMTVTENLQAGAFLIPSKIEVKAKLDLAMELFPIFRERAGQLAGTLSGGEQQMLAIARSLMGDPRLLCIDEPSTGLAPRIRDEVFEKILSIRKLGITILLVEQEVAAVFGMADRNYVLSSGRIIAQGTGAELSEDETIRRTYLGL